MKLSGYLNKCRSKQSWQASCNCRIEEDMFKDIWRVSKKITEFLEFWKIKRMHWFPGSLLWQESLHGYKARLETSLEVGHLASIVL